MKFLFSWKGLVIAIIILLVLIALLINFKVNGYERYDKLDEFEFELFFGAHGLQNLNTFEDTITKDLIYSGTITSDYVFPEYSKKRVYSMMMDMDILTFPSNLVLPNEDEDKISCLTLKLVIDGMEKTIECQVPWGYKLGSIGNTQEQQYQFLTLVDYISSKVFVSGEWRNLQEN